MRDPVDTGNLHPPGRGQLFDEASRPEFRIVGVVENDVAPGHEMR